MRLLYMQRFAMLLVGYVRDFVLPAFRSGPAPPATPATPDPLPPGMFRFSINLINSEFHLPVHSRGLEGLGIVFDQLSICKSCPKQHSLDASYCLGPWVAEGRWLSEFHALAGLLSACAPVQWVLPSSLAQQCALRAPSQDVRGASIVQLRCLLLQASLATWCNANRMGNSLLSSSRECLTPHYLFCVLSIIRHSAAC